MLSSNTSAWHLMVLLLPELRSGNRQSIIKQGKIFFITPEDIYMFARKEGVSIFPGNML